MKFDLRAARRVASIFSEAALLAKLQEVYSSEAYSWSDSRSCFAGAGRGLFW